MSQRLQLLRGDRYNEQADPRIEVALGEEPVPKSVNDVEEWIKSRQRLENWRQLVNRVKDTRQECQRQNNKTLKSSDLIKLISP